MWPVLLHLTRDECRLKLRRLELEAYSNMVNVLRAQGALGDNRKKLLEELRAVLHISQDRHSAEARRVSNDQLLATIAEQLSGPNTGIAWICEGRRRVPLLPRGIPQTMYTELADRAAEAAAAENKEILKRLAAEKLVPSKINEEEMMDVEGYNQEALSANEVIDESLYAPVAMEDQTSKLWETELITRKRKPEGGGMSDDTPPPMKNIRNIPANTNQKHLNLSQIYSKFSQQASKPAGQSKHSYNQVSKVSTSKTNKMNKTKSNQPHAPRSTPHKPRAQKTPRLTKAQKKAQAQAQEIHTSPGKYNATMPLEYAGPPNTFQASYAQAVLGGKTKPDFLDELKAKGGVTDSPTMQLTQPTLPHELEVSGNTHPDDHPSLQAQSTPVKHPPTPSKPHVIVKNREIVDKKTVRSDLKIVQRPADIKLLSNRQVVIAPHRQINTPNKLVTTKVIGSLPKHRVANTPVVTEKMIVVSKPTEHKNPPARVIVTSSANTHTPRERTFSGNYPVHRIPETLTPKGLPATDLKVSTKALVLNPKGQKMVVVPASKARTKPEGQIPLIHFKGISTAMKLLPIGSQPQMSQVAKSPAIQVLSKPPTQTKIIGMDNAIPIKTANLADIVPVKGMTPSTPKISNPILRPSSTKGNVIVVQKGTPIGKALAFAKNGNDMSKIIMGKNVTQLLQASKSDADAGNAAGNVIVLELNNEQSGRPTTMSEILDSRTTGARPPENQNPAAITPDTPVLFESQITEETCNANSLDSTTESIGCIVDPGLMMKDEAKSNYSKDSQKDSSSVTDWEMELDTVVDRKDKDDDDKLNSLHLDLGMSSDSDSEYMATGRKTKGKQSRQRPATTSGEGGEVYSSSSAMSVATRTLLSQLQDEGSSSNDSSFALRARTRIDSRLDRNECDELTKAKEKLSEKVRDALSQRRRIDLYSTAITPTDINLESFAYLEEGIMVGDEVFDEKRDRRADGDALDVQLSHILGVEANSNDSQPVSELPLSK